MFENPPQFGCVGLRASTQSGVRVDFELNRFSKTKAMTDLDGKRAIVEVESKDMPVIVLTLVEGCSLG